MLAWTLIVIQVAAAAAALHVLRWHVLPHLPRMPQRALIIDVWGPLAVVLPLLCSMNWTAHSVRGDGWPGLGGPVVCGLIALAAMAISHDRAQCDQDEHRWPRLAVFTAMLAGMILLLLGAAHVMHILVGQIALAIIAVILWINTPDTPRNSSTTDEHIGVWVGMIIMLACAAAMGMIALWMAESMRWASTAVMLGYAAGSIFLYAMYAGSAVCMRIGLWSAGIGVLASLGVLSIVHMLPQALRIVLGAAPSDIQYVAYGFGAYTLEAAIMLVLPLMMFGTARLQRASARFTGLLVLAATASLVIWRLTAV